MALSTDIAFINRESSIRTQNAAAWWANFFRIINEIYSWGLFLSAIPLFFILNSLLDKGIEERVDQENINLADDVSARLSINNLESTGNMKILDDD
jgi:hypothetical protein